MSKEVFLSHASADKDAAALFCNLLEKRDVGCWIAPRDVLPGADYAEAIIQAIEATRVTVLLLSKQANASLFVRNEVERAISKGKRVIPVRLEPIQPGPALELYLATAQWLDAWNLSPQQTADKLAHVIRSREPIAEPPGAERSSFAVKLQCLAGPHEGNSQRFEGHETYLVGRSSAASCRLEKDAYFSRHHFLLEINPPLCRLVDLNSTNGTKVNGKPVRSAEIGDGDEISGGTSRFRVTIDQADGEAQTRLIPAAKSRDGATLPPAETPPSSPQIPGYEILEKLGHGGMGIVYRARHTSGRYVALKTILPEVQGSGQIVQRFLREASTLRELEHPHIVAFRDMGEADGMLYFSMDLVQGRDAGRIMKEEGPLAIGRAVRLVCQMLEALAFAHRKNAVHRDVKPANLLVAEDCRPEAARLADFGLAKKYQESSLSGLTLTSQKGGTPLYMAPEQILNFKNVTPAADQYSAAATLYALLTDKPLFDGITAPAEAFRGILEEKPVPLQERRVDVPQPLAEAIHKGLSREVAARFRDVAAFRVVLLPFADAP